MNNLEVADMCKQSYQDGVGVGMAISAAILLRTWGAFTEAAEIIGAAGIETEEDAVAIGVEEYDLEVLRKIF